jgi:hypothetical protein
MEIIKKLKKHSCRKWARHKKKLHKKRRLLRKCKRVSEITHSVEKESVINYLSKLDLSKKPEKEIKIALKQIKLPFIIAFPDVSDTIYRAVVNTKEEPEFYTASRISYPPKERNKDYNRASTPNNVMFYGAIIPDDEEDAKEARKTTAMETCGLLRNSEKNGTELVTFGKWRIKDSINLVMFVDPNEEYPIPGFKAVADKYKQWIKEQVDSKEIQKELDFFVNEFSRKVEDDKPYKYMISALFTENLVSRKNIDGVLYPSVQDNENGLCVAIKPNVVDKKLELIKVLQSKLTKEGTKATLKDIKCCEVNPPNSDFQLEPCE